MICRSTIVSANTIGHLVAVQMITPHSATSAFKSLAKFLPGSVEYFCSFQPKVKGRVTVSAFWNIGGDSTMSHHYSGPDFGFPRGDARLDFTDLYAFPKPGNASKSILVMNV